MITYKSDRRCGARKPIIKETADRILKACCSRFMMTERDIFIQTRKNPIVSARQIAIYLMIGQGFSVIEIGKLFNLDHTTVTNAKKRCLYAIQTKGDIYPHLSEIEKSLAYHISPDINE